MVKRLITRSQVSRNVGHDLPNPVPVMALGHSAVDERHQKIAIGRPMPREAMQRMLDFSQSAGVRALRVHAIDGEAMNFLLRYGFALPIETPAASL